MVESQELSVASRPKVAPQFPRPPLSTFNSQLAFTLIELLVVISIIGILAGFTIPVLKTFKRTAIIKQTTAEMAQLETAIDSFKAAYGFYPPSNAGYNPGNPLTRDDALFNPLYFELLGTITNSVTGKYQTLDGSASIKISALMAPTTPLGVSGFVNWLMGFFIFHPIDPSLPSEARSEILNSQLGTMTQWSIFGLMIPLVIFLIFFLRWFSKQVYLLSGFTLENLMIQNEKVKTKV